MLAFSILASASIIFICGYYIGNDLAKFNNKLEQYNQEFDSGKITWEEYNDKLEDLL